MLLGPLHAKDVSHSFGWALPMRIAPMAFILASGWSPGSGQGGTLLLFMGHDEP